MEPAAATIILTPILAPIALKLHVDLVPFGLIMTVNLAMGFVAPPVGSNLFVGSAVCGLKVEEIARAALPMVGLMIALLFLITYVPQISLFLPSLMRQAACSEPDRQGTDSCRPCKVFKEK